MNLKDSTQKNELINAIEENGTDWEVISKKIHKPVKACKKGFEDLQKEFKKQETQFMKQVLGTGGGPPPFDDDNPLKTLKKILDPQVDGLYTLYDGDSELMSEYQETLPDGERLKPIEIASKTYEAICGKNTGIDHDYIEIDHGYIGNSMPATLETPVRSGRPILTRQDILKKKKDTALMENNNDRATKKTCNETFKTLAEAKMELVKIQTEVASVELKHKMLQLEDADKENRYKEEMRTKELILIDLKIKKASQ